MTVGMELSWKWTEPSFDTLEHQAETVMIVPDVSIFPMFVCYSCHGRARRKRKSALRSACIIAMLFMPCIRTNTPFASVPWDSWVLRRSIILEGNLHCQTLKLSSQISPRHVIYPKELHSTSGTVYSLLFLKESNTEDFIKVFIIPFNVINPGMVYYSIDLLVQCDLWLI